MTQLTVGMFVQDLDQSWLKHPFWRTRFLIDDDSRLRELQGSGVQYCWIDISKGCDVPVGEPEASSRSQPGVPQQRQAPAPRASFADELQRAAQLRARSAKAMREMFAEARLGNAVEPQQCGPLVNEIVESIDRHPDALLSLVRLKNADEYTYMHSMAVCALMVSLARQLDLSETECHEAGMAGMLHDLGKAAMPQEILNKPGRLTDTEFEVIKQHPLRGHEMLYSRGKVSEGVMDVSRHHHERFDGTGYPDGLHGEEISLLARMSAVCDVYDAVTSDRPYKSGWDPAYALSQMASWEGHFDPRIFQLFVKSLGIYPPGSLVRTRTGRLAVVMESHPSLLTKPRIKVFFSTSAGLPLEPQVIDLASAHATDQIVAREPRENWQFPYIDALWCDEDVLRGLRS